MARQALTLTGAFIGAAVGAPQLGFFLGSLVGNAVDPVRIKAPSIGDISQQTSAEGVACPLYAGTAGGAGNLVYCSEPDIVDGGTSSGKGGPEVENPDRAYVTFIIRIGASLFDGPGYRMGITSLIKVWEDEKLVYDVSPTSQILAESAEYAKTFSFYPGNYTQLPDPDVEAIEGVGNVPAYRGRAIFVKKRHDVTDRRGSIPSYRFEVSVNGAPARRGATLLTARYWYGGTDQALEYRDDAIGFTRTHDNVRVDPSGLFAAGHKDGTLAANRFEVTRFNQTTNAWELLPTPADIPAAFCKSVAWDPTGKYLLVVFSGSDPLRIYPLTETGLGENVAFFASGAPAYSLDNGYWNRDGDRLIFTQSTSADPIILYDFNPGTGALSNKRGTGSLGSLSIGATVFDFSATGTYIAVGGTVSGAVLKVNPSSLSVVDSFVRNCGQGLWWSHDDTHLIAVGTNTPKGGVYAFDPEAEDITFVANFTDDITGSVTDSCMSADRLTLAVAGSTPNAPQLYSLSATSPPVVTKLPAQPLAALSPVSVAYALGESTLVQAGYTTFEQVVLATGRRCRMPDSVWNLPGLDAKVIRGTVVASQGYTGQDFLNSLRTVFPCDGATFDGKVHILLRGGEIDLELDDEFRVEEESDLEQEEVLRNGDEKRQANLRRPARINVMYPNANVGYNLTKAMPPAFGDRGDAVGETSLQVPVVLDETTEAPQLADVLDKISRADAEAEIVRVWPEYLAASLVPGSLVRLVSGGLSRRTRVENIRRGDGTVRVLSRIDRAHAYGSLATAQPSPGWPQPPPSLVGDTTAVFLNLPALVDDQDRLGLVAAISGDPGSAWHGARIEWRVQGTTTWTTLGTYTARAVLGTLLEDLPGASPYWPDWTNQVRVRLLQDDQIESLTDTEWLSEMGAFAIRRADGTAEIIQARDAVNDSGQDWTLTMLQRGRLDTDSATGHSAGAQVVFLDNSLFLALPISAIGQTLEFRVTSLGASPETAPTFTLAWDPAMSQREWSPMGLELARAGGTISGSFSPRHRFGTDVVPVPSGNVLGYRVTLTDGTTTQVLPDTTATTFSTSDAAFSGPITVTVQTLNRYTGPGPGTSETL